MKTNQSGASHLMLVLIISLLLLLLSLAIQSLVYLQTKQTTRNINSREAYFAAEGALFSTLQSIRDNPSEWIDKLPVNDTFTIGDSQISRHVYQEANVIYLEITSDNLFSRRSLLGELSLTESDESVIVPQDVMLVVDTSNSMSGEMNDVRTAVNAFIQLQKDAGVGTRIGAVKAGGALNPVFPLTDDYDQLLTDLDYVSDPPDVHNDFYLTQNPSAMSIGLRNADVHLTSQGDPDKPDIIIALSDGIPTTAYPNLISQCGTPPGVNPCIDDNICFNPGSGFNPLDGGNCCSNNAIDIAADIKSRGVYIHTIFLNNGGDNYRCTAEGTSDIYHGQLTMLHVSSQDPPVFPTPETPPDEIYYYETFDSGEFEFVFTGISGKLSTPGYFQYSETVPSPD